MANEEDMKRAYEEKAKIQLYKLNAKINELKAKSQRVQADAKIEYQNKLIELYEKRDTARAQLQALQDSSQEAWIEMKQGFEKAWAELDSAWKNAVGKF